MQDATRSSISGSDPTIAEETDVKHREKMLDEALEETFPASDPVSLSHLNALVPSARTTDR